MAVDPNIAAVVAWAGQLFIILSGALILVAALTVIGYFHDGKTEKKLKQTRDTLELMVDAKANTDKRLAALELTVQELARRADGVKTTAPDNDDEFKVGAKI